MRGRRERGREEGGREGERVGGRRERGREEGLGVDHTLLAVAAELLLKDVSGNHSVHGTERVVKEIELCPLVDGPGQVDPGLLASTEGHAPLPNEGVVFVWKLLYVLCTRDEVVCDGRGVWRRWGAREDGREGGGWWKWMGDGVGSGGEDSCVRGVGEGLHRYYSTLIKAQASMTSVYHSLSKQLPKRMFSLRVPEKTQGSWEA